MTPTTAQRPVLKIHMASDARPLTLPGGVPTEQKSVNDGLFALFAHVPTEGSVYSRLVEVRLSLVSAFSTVHDTLRALEMLTFR